MSVCITMHVAHQWSLQLGSIAVMESVTDAIIEQCCCPFKLVWGRNIKELYPLEVDLLAT